MALAIFSTKAGFQEHAKAMGELKMVAFKARRPWIPSLWMKAGMPRFTIRNPIYAG
jgi:hypothetical protein